jgi:hypothetical protein
MFQINDYVVVKPGVKDPDNEQFDLSGWQGRVLETEPQENGELLVTILWDSVTLLAQPKVFLEDCLLGGYDFSEMTLFASELEAATARDTEEDRIFALQELQDATYWLDAGEQGKRIQAIEDACDEDTNIFDVWLDHLTKMVTLPVRAQYMGESNQLIRLGDEVEINGFSDIQEIYGVIVSVKYKDNWQQFPLGSLQIEEINENTQALEDYLVWFAEVE